MALTPWNRQEEWYQEMIDAIGEGGGGGLPEVTSEDKGKYLHVNDSTGDLEWSDAGGSGGGGVLVVTDTDGTLDKTWQEIHDAMLSGGAVIQIGETEADTVLRAYVGKGTYFVSADGGIYSASSVSGYPSQQAH